MLLPSNISNAYQISSRDQLSLIWNSLKNVEALNSKTMNPLISLKIHNEGCKLRWQVKMRVLF